MWELIGVMTALAFVMMVLPAMLIWFMDSYY